MAKQTKSNIGNQMIITPKRKAEKETTHPHTVAGDMKKMLNAFWGANPVKYKAFPIADIRSRCPDTNGAYGMMMFSISETDLKNGNVQALMPEPYNKAILDNASGGSKFYFVFEGYYLWREDGSEYAANGFGRMRNRTNTTTHLLATFGKEMRGNSAWYHFIFRAGYLDNGKPVVIEEFEGAAGDPPGAGTIIPPPKT
jgi:hypothetical protein